MIAQPGVKVIQCSADNVIEVTFDHQLKGKLRELRTCSMRLGLAKDKDKIKWIRRYDCRGNYTNGHVVECLKEEDIPKTGKGENVYCQFLFEPKYVIDEKTGKIEENYEGETLLSPIVTLIALASAAKYKALLKDTAKAATAPPL